MRENILFIKSHCQACLLILMIELTFFSPSSFLPQRTRGRRDRATRRIKARLGEVEDSVMSLPFHVEVAFSAWGRPRLAPAVADSYGSFQELPCSLTQKNEQAPGRYCAKEPRLQDGHRRSRGETDLLVTKERRGFPVTIVQIRHISQTAGGPLLDSGHMRKKSSCLCFSMSYLFLLIIIFNLTSCPVGPV